MVFLTKSKRAELTVLATIVLIVLLNSMVFTGLGIGRRENVDSALYLLTYSSFIYIFFFIGTFLAILLKKGKLTKLLFYLFILVMTINVILNLFFLITDQQIQDNGLAILSDAFLIWIVDILVFTLWFWIIDRGGPIQRELESKGTRYDLLFPQYQSVIPGWSEFKPRFWDYLFFSVITSTSFAPAETLPLTIRVKILMMIEIAVSLIIIAMVASRAISLIQ